MTKKAVWISFDMGLKGDYKGLYTFLDNHKAVECGQGLAFINYNLANSTTDNILEAVKNDIKNYVTLAKSDRIYVIWRDNLKIKGEFINGSRKQSPWEGYGNIGSGQITDTGE